MPKIKGKNRLCNSLALKDGELICLEPKKVCGYDETEFCLSIQKVSS